MAGSWSGGGRDAQLELDVVRVPEHEDRPPGLVRDRRDGDAAVAQRLLPFGELVAGADRERDVIQAGARLAEPVPADRRRVLIEMTGSGKETLERLLPGLHQAEVSWTDGLSQPQKAALLRSIGQLQGHLRTNPGQPRP